MQTATTQLNGFPAVARPDARILILGSMPSTRSLTEQQYYAHARNSFWKIITQLFQVQTDLSYNDKLLLLQQQGIALWDVIQGCERLGSLDSNINNTSIISNNFNEFFQQHRQIEHLFFNGSKAYNTYQTYVIPHLAEPWRDLAYTRLPSTSRY